VNWVSDGHVIHARLYQPQARGEEPPPLLVWLHQGPTGQTRATLEPRIAYFVERGWAALVPDHRGSTGWGRDFMLALDGHWGEADVADVVAGIKVASQKGWGDANRVALYGGSAGGFLLLRLLATHPGLCSAGVALFPVCHLLDTDTPPWRYQTYYVERLLGGRPTERSDIADRSPLKYPGKISRPILILHGADDHIVPAWHSEALADAVNAAGGIAERHVYQGERHGWAGGKTLADELSRAESFLERHVLSARKPN
jgi:dipeptidyl aminopeptidase/acylaminoacyl peptidase